ncbi:MAG: hypothetical protein HC840_21780 [Leptolyngbyaceae cyanobacterium RM2_2_4]|nr:hypothetical protein [Leptolyngbyaceae cyanobacterium RM2_2_4]
MADLSLMDLEERSPLPFPLIGNDLIYGVYCTVEEERLVPSPFPSCNGRTIILLLRIVNTYRLPTVRLFTVDRPLEDKPCQ